MLGFRVVSARKAALRLGVCLIAVLAAVAPATAGPQFGVTNLITNNQGANPAKLTDPNLTNPWGVSFGPTTPLWVSNNDLSVASLYSLGANDSVSIVTNPALFPVHVPGGVTGQNFNPGAGAGAFNGDAFLFVAANGAVEGWRPALGNTAEILVPGSTANSYNGSTLVTVNGNEYLLAANTTTGNIDVISGTANQPALSGNFKDPNLPTGFVPYNVQVLNGVVYVTYFNSATNNGGIVDAFTTSGTFMGRIGTGGTLAQPWGLAIAPTSFGSLAGDLLVGNKANGEISVFSTTGTALGTLNGPNGSPIVIQDLWALFVGNDHGAGSSQEIYFTAGVNFYENGLFGSIQSVPEPGTAVLGVIAMAVVAAGIKWKKRLSGAKANA
jgi:uncharacterized protein (TIGR03118 family)